MVKFGICFAEKDLFTGRPRLERPALFRGHPTFWLSSQSIFFEREKNGCALVGVKKQPGLS